MRIIRYLKHSVPAVLLIAALLVVQAFTDLSLPRYTSHIVDIGIQQSGVENVAPDEMRGKTFEEVAMLLPTDDENYVRGLYEKGALGTYALTEAGRGDIARLDSVLALPLVIIHYASQVPDLDLDKALAAYQAGTLPKDQVLKMVDKARSEMGNVGDSIIRQQAVQATIAEYRALGRDTGAMQMDYLLKVGAIMLGLTAVGMAAAIGVSFIASRTAAKVGRSLRGRLFRKVVSFSDAEVQSFSAASLITRGTNDIQQIQMVTVMLLRLVLYAPILAAGGIIMVARTDLSMGWIIILAVVVIFVLVIILMKIALPKFKIMQKLIDRVNLVSREILTGIPVIRAFNRQADEQARFDAASTDLMHTQLFTNRVMTFMMPLMLLIMNGVSVLIVWVGGSYIDQGTIQTGDMIAFITYSMVIITSFLMISMIAIMLPRADVAAQRINEVLDTPLSISDPEPGRAKSLTGTGGAEIVFDDVSFAYADSKECVLEHISFTAHSSKTTAIVGSTGSGKSTVIKLIERFYDVSSGAITVDGIDIRDLTQHELRKNLGLAPQKAFLFSGDIRSNVAFAAEGATDEHINHVSGIAQASEFIDKQEEGLAAPISQGGTNVSGGQRQRLAIARALATDARALLFDDSFSALDYKTDAKLRAALDAQLGNKTVIIVAQRISTVLSADQIVVLDEGHMVGCGTHTELMETCKTYREIATSQLSAEELKGGGAA